MARVKYTPEHLAEAVTRSTNWCDLMRRLGRPRSGGLRKQLQKLTAEHGIDASHFKQESGWTRYPDAAIAEAVACSTTMREVALHLGAVPASGTLSHLRGRAARLRLDLSHFPLMPSDPRTRPRQTPGGVGSGAVQQRPRPRQTTRSRGRQRKQKGSPKAPEPVGHRAEEHTIIPGPGNSPGCARRARAGLDQLRRSHATPGTRHQLGKPSKSPCSNPPGAAGHEPLHPSVHRSFPDPALLRAGPRADRQAARKRSKQPPSTATRPGGKGRGLRVLLVQEPR
jgi:hypothetical protein